MNGKDKRRRRRHTAAFKAEAVAACATPGVSLAGVALERQINANLLRRWVKQAGRHSPVAMISEISPPSRTPAFLPVALEGPRPVAADRPIRVELRRRGLVITIEWPASAAHSCAGWLGELIA